MNMKALVFLLAIVLLILFAGILENNQSSPDPSRAATKSTPKSNQVPSLPALSSFGITEGMTVDQVAINLKGKVSGVDWVSPKRVRNILTGDLDGSYTIVTTHSIHYDVPGVNKKLRVYFWNDVVRSIEWRN